MAIKSHKSRDAHISSEMLTTWYQALLNRYNTVNNAITSIDNKTSIILAASVAVLIFGAERVLNSFDVTTTIGISGLVICIILSIMNINLREAPGEVNSSEDRPDYYSKTDDEFIWQLIADLENSISLRATVNRKKALLYRWTTSLFVVSSIILLLSNYIQISISFN